MTSADFLRDSHILNLDISLWSGRARLSREDLDPDLVDQLPPETLASLGSKKLIDPNTLKPMTGLKSETFKYLNQNGQRFLSGWIIPANNTDTITGRLSAMATEFNHAVDFFCQEYSSNVADWLRQFPEWRPLLQQALPSQDQIAKRFNYTFQVYDIAPLETNRAGDNLAELISGVPDKILQDTTAAIAAARRDVFPDDRTSYTDRSLNVLRALAAKLTQLAYIHPSLISIANVLSRLCDKYGGDAHALREIRRLLDHFSSMENVDAFLATYGTGFVGEIDFQTFLVSTTAPVPEPAAPAPEPAVPEVPAWLLNLGF